MFKDTGRCDDQEDVEPVSLLGGQPPGPSGALGETDRTADADGESVALPLSLWLPPTATRDWEITKAYPRCYTGGQNQTGFTKGWPRTCLEMPVLLVQCPGFLGRDLRLALRAVSTATPPT